ncbi:MAG: glycosyltransferase [Chloroflexi bacterium]|nr:glycosyltransferase [Chloroflexota bacterium]
MKILFVTSPSSAHASRWIAQLGGLGWDLHLFSCPDVGDVDSNLKNITVYHSLYGKQRSHDRSVKLRGIPVVFPRASRHIAYVGRAAMGMYWPDYRLHQLGRLIKKLRPDIIHSMEIQAGGYLVSEVKKRSKGEFPPWIVTNWGSDIYLFGRLASHVEKIKEVLAACDYYSCECHRDVQLAKQLGLKGEVLPVLPNTGGFNLEHVAKLRRPGPPSARRLILLKGYQGWAGRALVGLRAIALAADALKGYRVGIYLAGDDVKIAAELVSQTTGIPIDIIPFVSHDEMLRLFGQARVSIGLSISDAISTALLESMAMSAFPIQSCTACADEWITDGETGMIVPPEDPEIIAQAIRSAVTDDALVKRAAGVNEQVVRERLDERIIRPQVIVMYEKIVAEARSRAGNINKEVSHL